jgi:AcrR family transcriptional regulator
VALHRTEGLVERGARGSASDEQILLAALQCFVAKGYHGTSVRDIAARAGISVPGLYHHVASKMALLERLMDETMDDLNLQTESALAAAVADPVERLGAVVVAHVRFHCERPEESFVGNSELRSVGGAFRRRLIAKRDRQQAYFAEPILEGAETGLFRVPRPHETARAIASMCTAVATWYRRDGPLSADAIVSMYRGLALMTVGYPSVRRDHLDRRLDHVVVEVGRAGHVPEVHDAEGCVDDDPPS